MVRVKAAKPLQGFNVRFTFTDGSERQIDLEPYLRGPIFESLRDDLARFRYFKVKDGSIAWPNGTGIDPDVLYFGLRPAAWEKDSGA